METNTWIRHIGRRTLMVLGGLKQSLQFTGFFVLQLWSFLTHRNQMRFRPFVEQFYLVGPKNLLPILLLSGLVSSVITVFSGLQLSVFGAAVHTAFVLEIILPRFLGPIFVGLVVLFRSLSWLESAKVDQEKLPSYVAARGLAMLFCMPMLYIWYMVCSLLVNILIAPFFDVSIREHLDVLYSQVELVNYLIGLIKSGAFALIAAITTLYYQFHRSDYITKDIAHLLLFGTMGLLLSMAIIELISVEH